MVSLNCAVCGSKNFRFIKEKESSGILSSIGLRTPLSKIPLVSPILFQLYQKVNTKYKMNKIEKFLLAGDKFMPVMHYDSPGSRTALVDHLLKTSKK